MTEPVHVICPRCAATNRLPVQRLVESPRCGRCKSALFDAHPVALDVATFERHAAAGAIPLVVDFWAPWCAPCVSMAPQFEAAARVLEPEVRLAKVDTEAHPQLGARFGVRSIPTLILFRDGREAARQSGATGSAAIVQWVRSQIALPR